MLAVVLQGEIKDQLAAAQVGPVRPGRVGHARAPARGAAPRLAEPLAAAFASTFWWAVGISVLALIPATILALSQRRERGEEVAAFAEPEQQVA